MKHKLALINFNKNEGEVFNRWLYSRLIKRNKNVIGAELGGTGSGKSYRDLRKVELWYNFYHKREFPVANIVFGVPQAIERIASGELKKGEILIFEEAGANMGALDFQSKMSKMFSYVLQSFRSMNIGIFMNLPYLSMLNKQARMLLHYSFESAGIDTTTNMNKCKPKFHQVNQMTGKIYPKYLKVRDKATGKMITIKRFSFGMPSERLVNAYELKKANYLSELTTGFRDELRRTEQDAQDKMARQNLSESQLRIFNLAIEGLNMTEIAIKLGITNSSVSQTMKIIKRKGYEVKKKAKT